MDKKKATNWFRVVLQLLLWKNKKKVQPGLFSQFKEPHNISKFETNTNDEHWMLPSGLFRSVEAIGVRIKAN